ncbi:phage tail protein [Citrobacter portucalensis]|uniref:phage tail protein n=1 Tax=Citrobacter portucalensis TaxID=1639133 RepID=UPI002E2B32BC|nr:phage tail protein [Citrobacter portucalensis]
MATKYLALLTNIGAAKLAKATALGTKVEITQLAVGDGNGVLPTPSPAQTALVHERRRAPLNMLTVDPANVSQIIAEQVIPEDVGGWWIREIGLFDKDGDMVAIANCAETYKPQLQEGSGRVQVIRVILIVSSTEAVTLKIDPAVVLATRQYVDSQLRAHEQSRNHPDASTTEKGFVQLSSSVTSDSESQAATPKTVKIAMDNASARLAKDRNLSDLTNTALARQNLELGDSSTRNVGTTAGTVASGDDDRITGAMQKSQNGGDIPDVAKFLQNLGIPASYATKIYVNDNFAPLVSPPLSGIPTAPTAALGTYNLQLATTAFVQNAVNALIDSAPDELDTLKKLADALGNDDDFAGTVVAALAGKLNTSDLSFRSSADFFSVDFLGKMRIFSGNIAANFVAGKFSFTLPLAFPNANYSLIPYDPTGSINTYGKAVSGTVVEITGRDHNGTPSTGAIVLRYIATGLTQ